MRQTVFCNHYRAMSEHETCSAGVAYDSMKGMAWETRPCFSKPGDAPKPGCDLVQLPTPEELAADEAEMRERLEKIGKARQAIVSACGGPWKKGKPSIVGAIDCPNCGGKLNYSRAGYNGHVHARCATPGCVSWME